MITKKYNKTLSIVQLETNSFICQFLQTLSFSSPKFRDRTKDKVEDEFPFSILF